MTTSNPQESVASNPIKKLQVQKWILARLCGTTNHNLTYCCFRTEGDIRESRNDLLESGTGDIKKNVSDVQYILE